MQLTLFGDQESKLYVHGSKLNDDLSYITNENNIIQENTAFHVNKEELLRLVESPLKITKYAYAFRVCFELSGAKYDILISFYNKTRGKSVEEYVELYFHYPWVHKVNSKTHNYKLYGGQI